MAADRNLLGFIGALALSLSVASNSHAGDTATGGGQVVVAELEHTNRNSKGQLDACELRYIVAFQDNIYRQGAVTFLRGAVSFMGLIQEADKPPGILLKVTAFDLVGEKPVFAPLSLAYLTANGKSYAGKQSGTFTCEDGGQCVAYNFFDDPDLAASLGQTFEINITRANGSSDVRVPINVLRDFPKVSADFSNCSLELADLLMRKFGG
jgi:hypothetical protein